MNLYKDYYASCATTNSQCYAASDISNTIADMLVAHCGFTLIQHVKSGSYSSDSNAAQVSRDGFTVKIYYSGYNSSGVQMYLTYFKTGSTSASYTYATPYFSYNVKYQNAFEIKLRVLDTKSGIFFQLGGDQSGVENAGIMLKCYKISTNEEYVALLAGTSSSSGCYVNGDTSNLSIPLSGFNDVDNVKQVLSPVGVYVSGSGGCRYFLQDVFFSSRYIYSGNVQIGDRYFYIPGSSNICFECNAPS